MDYPKNLSEKDRYWLNIIQECRASGKSDYQWLQEHNIPSPTFYYHVKKLRKKACEIPERNQLCTVETQEVVPLVIEDTAIDVPSTTHQETINSSPALRLNVNGITIEINNSAEALKEPEIPQKDLKKYIPAEIGVAYCNKLFYLERKFKDLTFDEHKYK